MINIFLALLISVSAWATDPDKFPSELVRRFQELETTNSMIVKTQVDEKYRPKPGRIFKLPYVDVPESEMITVDSGQASDQMRKHFIIEKEGKKYVRFFIHPESMELYAPLVKKYGLAGELSATEHYLASPTASTRSLIAWDPKNLDAPAFIVKTSLAKQQDGLGRVIPDWEVRRSVMISKLTALTSQKEWLDNGTYIIPEVFGAYVPESLGLGFKVDAEQGTIMQHGFIVRDLSFLSLFEKNREIYPLFALFTERPEGAPLIVEWWKTSGVADFHEFLELNIIKPFVEKTGYLFFEQGIVPEVHSQNVLVAIDPKTHKIETVLHRDVGSMKVDLRLRLAKGRSIDPLKSGNASFDFKFKRATKLYEENIMDYFFDMTFTMDPTMGYGMVLKKAVPSYDSRKVRAKIKAEFWKQIKKHLPIASNRKIDKAEEHVKQFLEENPPRELQVANIIKSRSPNIQAWLAKQEGKKQFLDLPKSWEKLFRLQQGTTFLTDYGVVVLQPGFGNGARVYYYDNEKTFTDFLSQVEKQGGGICPLYLKKKP